MHVFWGCLKILIVVSPPVPMLSHRSFEAVLLKNTARRM